MKRLASMGLVLLAGSFFSVSALADSGVINLGPEEILKAKGQEIVVPGYSVPSLADWNNDGLQDLIVGEGGGGAPGKIRVYLNVGTEADPCFTDYFYVQANGGDLTCTPEGCLGCFPRVVYWNADQKKDLLVGLGDGTVQSFVNIGTDSDPAFNIGLDVRVGSGDAYTLDVGMRATPVLIDWNNDGMLDIVAGGLDGAVHVYYNCGCGGSVPPHFSFSEPPGELLMDQGHTLLVPSGRSSVVAADLDGDGNKDLLLGNTDGQILFYRNVAADSRPTFMGYTLVESNGVPIDLAGSLRTRPFACHWTSRGYWDLLVGYGDGKIRLYRAIPKLGDLNADGVLDGDDLTILAQALDKLAPLGGSSADLNRDGLVNILDLRLFADLWLAEYGADKK